MYWSVAGDASDGDQMIMYQTIDPNTTASAVYGMGPYRTLPKEDYVSKQLVAPWFVELHGLCMYVCMFDYVSRYVCCRLLTVF